MPPEIEIDDHANVTIDGRAAGAIVDVLANHAHDAADPDHAAFRAALHGALVAWHHARRRRHADELEALRRHADGRHAEALKGRADRHAAELRAQAGRHAEHAARAEAEHSKATVAARAEAEALRARVAELQGQVEALGGAELGQRMALERRREEARRAREEADAEIAAIEAHPMMAGRATPEQ